MFTMAMNGKELREKFVQTIFNGLKREFPDVSAVEGYQPVVDDYWLRLSRAIADIAMDAVNHVQEKADVIPGIQVATTTAPCIPGSPVPTVGATVSNGKIK